MTNVLASLQTVDAWAFHVINRTFQNPLFDLVMPILSTKEYAIAPAVALLLWLGLRYGRRGWLLLAVFVAAVALGDQGTNLLKAVFHRTRPCHVLPDVHLLAGCTRSFSLPSNHASNMFAIATVAWLTFRRWRLALFALAAAVAYSRIYLGVHYPSDVVLGALWGVAAGWVCSQIAIHMAPGGVEPDRQPQHLDRPKVQPDHPA